jgi:hypothetical protein
MKLIKINTDHYIIVDDSEIKEGDWVIDSLGIRQVTSFAGVMVVKDITHIKKITHSTQPFNCNCSNKGYRLDTNCAERNHCFDKIQYLSLQEVKELIGEVDVEALEIRYYQQLEQRREVAKNFTGQVAGRHPDMFGHSEVHNMVRGYLEGYNQALEDNKDRKYTEKDIDKAYRAGMQFVGEDKGSFGEFIQSLQTQTEWEVEIVDGKLKLM